MKLVPKIDIHVHAVPFPMIRRRDGSPFADPMELRRIYDEIGVEKGVLLPDGVYEAGSGDCVSPREAYVMARDFPETFGWWFSPISPYAAENTPDNDLSFYLEQYKAWGAKGVGEIEENLPFDDPYMENLFKHCEACGMPVIFHLGNKGGDYGIVDGLGLYGLEKALQKFPKLLFFGHSQKFWAEIGDCDEATRNIYPSGKVNPGRLVELFRKYPNLQGDLSAGSGANAILRDPEFGYEFLEEFSHQLYFGTDICAPQPDTTRVGRLSRFLDDAVTNGKISYETYERVSRGNALDVLEK